MMKLVVAVFACLAAASMAVPMGGLGMGIHGGLGGLGMYGAGVGGLGMYGAGLGSGMGMYPMGGLGMYGGLGVYGGLGGLGMYGAGLGGLGMYGAGVGGLGMYGAGLGGLGMHHAALGGLGMYGGINNGGFIGGVNPEMNFGGKYFTIQTYNYNTSL
ncbi:hypothetical protein SNE40_017822 [Patella caerulea]|uniref:Uncharacterized protein n=1 Tax=Patella caerulea TaxID=87958 RepID=A0AAN8JFN0_PATCE